MTVGHDLPIVRACQIARLSRAAYYKPGVDRMARDAEVIVALQAIVVEEQRWGFWKCHDRLRAQGYAWNHKRVWRVYCQLRLNLPRRTKRRVPQRERQPLIVEPRMNAVWALDFMRDTLYSGRVFRTVNVIDEANRGALGIDIAVSIPAARVIAFLTQMVDLHGRPAAIRCDNVLNASLLSSKSDSHPRRLAGAFDAIKTVHTTVNQWSSAVVGSLA
jgi:putative transposase